MPFYKKISQILFVVFSVCGGIATTASAESLVESSMEVRFQLDLQVSDSALMRFIPEGWSLNIDSQGPAKDSNLRAIFIERVTVNGSDGKPLGDGSNILVQLVAPVVDEAGTTALLVVGGITEETADAPGPFGVYLPATTHKLERTIKTESGPTIETQEWALEAASGEYFNMSVAYERGLRNSRPPRDRLFVSAQNASISLLTRESQMLDIVRNVTTKPADRVHAFSFSGGGGSYADLFNGSETVLSWDNIVWLHRDAYEQ